MPLPKLVIVLSRVIYVPPIAGSLILAKKDIWATNMLYRVTWKIYENCTWDKQADSSYHLLKLGGPIDVLLKNSYKKFNPKPLCGSVQHQLVAPLVTRTWTPPGYKYLMLPDMRCKGRIMILWKFFGHSCFTVEGHIRWSQHLFNDFIAKEVLTVVKQNKRE